MPKHPIPMTENHHVQKTCAKIMHKTIGGSAQPNIGSIKWGYGYPSNPLLTIRKKYNTTQKFSGRSARSILVVKEDGEQWKDRD